MNGVFIMVVVPSDFEVQFVLGRRRIKVELCLAESCLIFFVTRVAESGGIGKM